MASSRQNQVSWHVGNLRTVHVCTDLIVMTIYLVQSIGYDGKAPDKIYVSFQLNEYIEAA